MAAPPRWLVFDTAISPSVMYAYIDLRNFIDGFGMFIARHSDASAVSDVFLVLAREQ